MFKIRSQIFYKYILIMKCLLSQPHLHTLTQKNSCRMVEGKKIMEAHTPRKIFLCELTVGKKFMTRPNHPLPPPPLYRYVVAKTVNIVKWFSLYPTRVFVFSASCSRELFISWILFQSSSSF